MGRASRRKREQREGVKPRLPHYVKDNTLFVGRPPLPAVEAWLTANREAIPGPGKASVIEIWHDASCRYPQGALFCTCQNGPECKLGETL